MNNVILYNKKKSHTILPLKRRQKSREFKEIPVRNPTFPFIQDVTDKIRRNPES